MPLPRGGAGPYPLHRRCRPAVHALSVIWQSKDRCVSDTRELQEGLYGDREEELADSTLRDLRGTLNEFFRGHHIPYKAIVRDRSTTIAIKHGELSGAKPPKRTKPERKKKNRR